MKEFFFNKSGQIVLDDIKFSLKKIDNILLFFLIEGEINPNIAYDNVIAICAISGRILWKVEKYLNPKETFGNFKSLGPFVGALPSDIEDYIILTKAHGWKVLVNKENGKIDRKVDLNKGSRPW